MRTRVAVPPAPTPEFLLRWAESDIRMANGRMKKCPTSLGIRETPIKATVRYHLMAVRMAKINKAGSDRCW